ncbi:hypothetical protein BRC83_10490 [Halobacteriales archaeon QS_1_68_17]|nr:MAG: hypothetical protein BRC83_10490 [Halobacteriales archaeon QS_1_68_17]
MGLWLTLAGGAAAVSGLLLAVLAGIWARNYRTFRTKHTLGLSVFAVLLLAENLLSVYYYLVDPQVATLLNSAAPIAGRAMMFVQLLELGGILFLSWVTWD